MWVTLCLNDNQRENYEENFEKDLEEINREISDTIPQANGMYFYFRCIY